MQIRPAALSADADSVWAILEHTIRAGETYPLPREMSREDALDYWFASRHEVFVAEEDAEVVGTYFLQANQQGGGSHVANCGYVTAPRATGRGVARAMCAHSLDRARQRGFTAMQFNFCGEHQRARRGALAKFRLPNRRPTSRRVPSSNRGLRRCSGDVSIFALSVTATPPPFASNSTPR